MPKPRSLHITIDKYKYVVQDAELQLNDALLYGANKPQLKVNLQYIGAGTYKKDHIVWFIGLRSPVKGEYAPNTEAYDYMDTLQRWTETYGVHIEPSYRSRIEVREKPFQLQHEDHITIKLCEIIFKEMRKRNIHRISMCEMMQIVDTLEAIGIYVKKTYNGNTLHHVVTWKDRANRKSNAEKETNQ